MGRGVKIAHLSLKITEELEHQQPEKTGEKMDMVGRTTSTLVKGAEGAP